MPGTDIPNLFRAGTFYVQGDWVFWDVRHPEQAIIIDLADERYAQLIVEVEDPQAAVQPFRTRLPATKTMSPPPTRNWTPPYIRCLSPIGRVQQNVPVSQALRAKRPSDANTNACWDRRLMQICHAERRQNCNISNVGASYAVYYFEPFYSVRAHGPAE